MAKNGKNGRKAKKQVRLKLQPWQVRRILKMKAVTPETAKSYGVSLRHLYRLRRNSALGVENIAH